MCDPRWIYGLPLDLGSIFEYAREKAPECFIETRRSTTAVQVVGKYQRILHSPITMEMGYDVFDDNLEPVLVLVLHEEDFDYSELRLEDENFLRKELGIEEKAKWYRYVGAFSMEELGNYKKRVPELGSIPSREEAARNLPDDCSANVTQLTNAVATVAV
ncbi:hypothetical protein SCHPADRAFT_897974 [Schizopora paradoxa]|uniref:Uncharacterized protein n=1 Tax=Schizopora paradoxa TaxID=27342 RepID=A0A0H2S8Y6_9AGAM|nr:hypothetical protein SCHPADRAFT_897974 [Schizopora paradoxa]